jgi:ketosteroid isomerase-like protein
MKTRLIAVVLLVSLFVFPAALYAQGTDSESVLKAITEALHKKDVEAAVALLADDIVQTLVPPPSGTGVYKGKEEMRARFKEVVAVNAFHKFNSCQTSGDKATCSVTYSDDGLKAMGVASIEMTAEATVQGGKLKAVTWTVSQESLTKLQAAMAPKTLPKGGGTTFPGYALIIALGALALVGGLSVTWAHRHSHGR